MNENKSVWKKDQHGFHYCVKCGNDAAYKYNMISKNYYEHPSPYCPMCGCSMELEEGN